MTITFPCVQQGSASLLSSPLLMILPSYHPPLSFLSLSPFLSQVLLFLFHLCSLYLSISLSLPYPPSLVSPSLLPPLSTPSLLSLGHSNSPQIDIYTISAWWMEADKFGVGAVLNYSLVLHKRVTQGQSRVSFCFRVITHT